MRIAKKYSGAGVAIVLVASCAVQSLSTVQAQKFGYVQADCPTIVKQAIDTVSDECSKAGRNQLCYGNSTINAVFQPNAGNPTFQAPGDTVDVAQIKQFTLGGMDTAAKSWGVAEMKIKADLPDTDPTQNVTMILFGSVQLTDGDSDANAAVLTQTPGAVARQTQAAAATKAAINRQATNDGPTATTIAGLERTATAKAMAPTPTGTIPAFKATQAAATATKLANMINTATAAPNLRTTTPETSVSGPYKGLQAVYFQSSDTAPCDQAPHDGILIQSPPGKQRVTLSIDGATVSLGSTVYITAQPGKFLTVNTLEGSAHITAAGQTQDGPPGTAIQVPLDANLHVSGPPAAPQFYTADASRVLPIQPLPNPIIPAPGLPSGAVGTNWTFSYSATSGICGTSPAQTFPITMVTDIGNKYLWISGGATGTNLELTLAANGLYQETFVLPLTNLTGQIDGTDTANYSLRFVDTTHMTGQLVDNYKTGAILCTTITPISITKVSPTGP